MSAKPQSHGKNEKTAITPTRADNFPEWYQEVIKAADMAENSPAAGCMIIKPYGYAIWEYIQRALDDMIRDAGVQNAYFPLLIPLSFLSREAEHVEGFAKECAVVTHHRLEKGPEGGLIPAPASKLEEPLIVRPTSETIIGDAMSRWVQSYRDLPLKLNQWANVMRWEMRPRMFIRPREFLWQEGHNAFETAEEARADALKMLDVYERLYHEWLAVPGIKGEKTPDERFPGANSTLTVEALMQDGKALQACTSHDLGQNFAKSIGIKFQGRDGREQFAYTTSWGLTIRSVGALIMTHGDDDGLILPPKVAPQQVVIIPVIRDESAAGPVLEACAKLAAQLKEKGIRAQVDSSEKRTPDKMWAAIKKGVPVRVEIGAREVEQGTLTWVRRDLGRDSKTSESVGEFLGRIAGVLEAIQAGMLDRARSFRDASIRAVSGVKEIADFYAGGGSGQVLADAAILNDPGLEAIMKDHGLTPRCLPLADNGKKVLIGKAY